MDEMGQAYYEYLDAKHKLDTVYHSRINEIKKVRLGECKIKTGMIVKYHKWIGRIVYVGFVGVSDEDQVIQAMMVDSNTVTRVPIDEKDFSKIQILEEKTLNMKILKESLARLEQEKASYKVELKKLSEMHAENMKSLEKDLEILREDCIHDWKMEKPDPELCFSGDGSELVYRCSICKKEVDKPI